MRVNVPFFLSTELIEEDQVHYKLLPHNTYPHVPFPLLPLEEMPSVHNSICNPIHSTGTLFCTRGWKSISQAGANVTLPLRKNSITLPLSTVRTPGQLHVATADWIQLMSFLTPFLISVIATWQSSAWKIFPGKQIGLLVQLPSGTPDFFLLPDNFFLISKIVTLRILMILNAI